MIAPRLVRRRWTYPFATIVIGVVWYLAFLATPGGWDFMTHPSTGIAGPSPIIPLICFPITSFILGALSRPIFEWTGNGVAVITGLSATFVGSILYVWLLVFLADAVGFMRHGNFEALSQLDLRGGLAMTCIGPVIAFKSGLVTVPAAVGSGLLLRWLSRVAAQPSLPIHS